MACLFGVTPLPFRAAIEHAGGIELPDGTSLFPVYHCGARILNTHRPMEKQLDDWRRIGGALFRREAGPPI